MLSNLKQLTTLKNKNFQRFDDVKQTKNQLQINLENIYNKTKIAKKNIVLLTNLNNEFTVKIAEINEFKQTIDLQQLHNELSKATDEFTKIEETVTSLENQCFEKSKQLQKLIDSFL